MIKQEAIDAVAFEYLHGPRNSAGICAGEAVIKAIAEFDANGYGHGSGRGAVLKDMIMTSLRCYGFEIKFVEGTEIIPGVWPYRLVPPKKF